MTTNSISITRVVPGGQVTVDLVYLSANQALADLGRVLRSVTDDVEAFEIEQTLGPAEDEPGSERGE